jgi:putative ABC transport system permease protein
VDKNHRPQAATITVDAGYFAAMGIPILRGRSFLSGDRHSTQPVVLINEETVQRYFRTTNPIGMHLRIGDPKDQATQISPLFEIVGVVGSTKSIHYDQIAAQATPEIYVNFRQTPPNPHPVNSDSTELNFVIHTRRGLRASDASLRRAVWAVDPNLPIADMRSLNEMLAEIQTQPRVRAQLFAIFAVFTLFLATIGVYGVMAQSVTQRIREIGVRMAVGADRRAVVLLVLRQAMALALFGIAIGVGIAIVSSRFIRVVLYEVSPVNPVAYGLVCALISFITLLSSVVPARRAASIDPTQALRNE